MYPILSYPLQLKAVGADGERGRIRGLAAAYGNADRHGHRFVAGAFAASIRELRGAKLPMLLEHVKEQPVGVWEKFTESSKGLEAVGTLDFDFEDAQHAYKLARAGIAGLSVGFLPGKDGVRLADDGVLEITGASLAEVSLTVLPANTKARVLSVKSLAECETLGEVRDCLAAQGLSLRESKAIAPTVLKTLSGGQTPIVADPAGLAALAREVERLRKTLHWRN